MKWTWNACVVFSALALTVPSIRLKAQEEWKNEALWKEFARFSANFIDRGGWDPVTGSCASEIGYLGEKLSDTRYLNALSRQLYGAVLSGVDHPHLVHSRAMASFLMRHLIVWDEPPYFVNESDVSGKAITPTELVSSEQAYGFLGLIALAQHTGDTSLRETVWKLFEAFDERFWDPRHSGYFDRVSVVGIPVLEKSYNSTVYVMTALLLPLADLMRHTPQHRRVVDRLVTLGDLIVRHFFADQTGWIVENFTADWKPSWRGWQNEGSYTIGVVGHGTQAAGTLLQLIQHNYGSRQQLEAYEQTARRMISHLFEKGAIGTQSGIVHNCYRREDNTLRYGTDGHWWQALETIYTLTLFEALELIPSDHPWTNARDKMIEFFFAHFLDRINGGVHAVVGLDGTPIPDRKGHAGKASMHDVRTATQLVFLAHPLSDEELASNYPPSLGHGPLTIKDRRRKALADRVATPFSP